MADDFDTADEDPEEWEHVAVISDAETAAVIEMAALTLDGKGDEVFERAMELPLAALPTTMAVAAMMVSSLAEVVAEYESRPVEQVLMELRLWFDDEIDDTNSGEDDAQG